jgi:hypothetical protein
METLNYKTVNPNDEDTFPIANFINIAIALIVLLFGLLPACLILDHYPDNHIDFDIRYLIFVPVVCTLWLLTAAIFRIGSPTLVFCLAMISLLVVAEYYFADHCNLMDGYGIWTGRGLPGCWKWTQ